MHFLDLILKKRGGGTLSTEEIKFFISSYVNGDIPDYQVSAMLMAIFFQKMEKQETCDLTFAMRDSGDLIDLSGIDGTIIDKHSTGGVADSTTLIVAPLVAACGLKVAKMSGRGLGHTGGTLDKLESIPGFQTAVEMEDFKKIVSNEGLSVIGQTQNIVPADKKLYALRDVTGTVDNISLIAASIMSKKLASGSPVIVLDVKTGNGAFMKEKEQARELAEIMIDIGKADGKRVAAMITDMNQPLGKAVGPAMEVKESIEILQGKHEGRLKELSVALAAQILLTAGEATDIDEAKQKIEAVLVSGEALARLKAMIKAQGGDERVCDDTALLPTSKKTICVKSEKEGFVSSIATEDIGMAALYLGAGRLEKEDDVDPAVGIWMEVQIGDKVEKGTTLGTFHVNSEAELDLAVQLFTSAIEIKEEQPAPTTLVYETLT